MSREDRRLHGRRKTKYQKDGDRRRQREREGIAVLTTPSITALFSISGR